jgi:hypothetical protein
MSSEDFACEPKRSWRVFCDGNVQLGEYAVRKAILVLALLATAATTALAQNQPNDGPARNRGGDSYGEPYSGTAAARQQAHGW